MIHLSLFKYPIFIGKKWNTTIEWMNTSTTIRLECNGKKEISTRAGKFDCYIIKANYTSTRPPILIFIRLFMPQTWWEIL